MTPSWLRYESPLMSLQGMPSATSLIVKSNSLRATKSTARAAIRLFSGSTATLAPMKPIRMSGLAALIMSAVFTSDLKDGVEVCITTRSRFLSSGAMSSNFRRRSDQRRALDQSRRLREPGWIPERADLAFHLIAGAGASVETVEGGRMQKQRSHQMSPRKQSRNCSSRDRVSRAVASHSVAGVAPLYAARNEAPAPQRKDQQVIERQHPERRPSRTGIASAGM